MKHVIIVEDHEEHAWLINRALSTLGFLTTISLDIFHILNQIERKLVDVIILDINLPGMASGDELISQIREKDKNIPIVMVTAASEESMRIKCLQLGANYYFIKPIDNKDLIQVFKQYL